MIMKIILYVAALLTLVISILFYWLLSDRFDAETIRNKRVIITGASQNIGKQVALQYAKFGANLVVTARNENQLQEVVETCIQLGAASAQYLVADMSALDKTEEVITKGVSMLGGLDILVLNHVNSVIPGFWNESKEKLDLAHRSTVVNYLSYVYLSTHAIPHLSKSGGSLIVVSSLAGYVYTTQQANYGATKAALNHFYSDLRLEMALQNNKSYSISICLLGTIATEKSRWEKYPTKIKMKGHPINDTALEIIKGGAGRRAYVFIPKWSMISSILRAFPTDLFDDLYLKYLYET